MKITRTLLNVSLAIGTLFGSQTLHSQTVPTVLTAEQVKIVMDNERVFKLLTGGLKSELYRGRAQNFSAFNLDLQTYIHFHRSPIVNNPNANTFNIASDGNQIIHGVPMWPIQGFVASYLTDKYIIDGAEVTLGPISKVYYLVESPQGHAERLKRWEPLKAKYSYQDYLRATGRIIGVVSMDMQNLSVDFYQLLPGTNELVRAGVFTGIVSRP